MSEVTMELQGIAEADINKAANGYETLGPAYFAAQRIADGVMRGAEDGPFKAVAAKAAELVRDELYDYVETHLLSDLECNIQGHLSRLVDDTVSALLTGQQWALERYPLSKRYDAGAVRAAILQHAGEGVVSMRIADLEKELAETKQALAWERESRSRY